MKKQSYIIYFIFFFCFQAYGQTPKPFKKAHKEPLQRIAFGSCAHQLKAQRIWGAVLDYQPELFALLGDNIYGDTENMEKLKKKYSRLANKEGFINLKKMCPVVATWDDHDYGRNDAGEEYPKKKESQKIFLDFFEEPKISPRRTRGGVYTSYMFGPKNKRVQIILLDTRFFRSPIVSNKDGQNREKYMGSYIANQNPNSTMLGKSQWQWLKKVIKKPAKLKIICTSIQFAANFTGYESWELLPREKEKMLKLIKETRTEGCLFISGDVHWGELSLQKELGLYPIYDLTSSGLTNVYPYVAPNKNRILDPYRGRNFGTIDIDWDLKDPKITLGIRDINGETIITKDLFLSELKFKNKIKILEEF